MRIRRLSLVAFGPFTGTSLDFDGPPGTLELVYGPNEAGKSTTLRSLSGLLFGIPHSTPDAHRHAPSELRIGAIIEAGDGTKLEIVRKKGRKGTLLDPRGNVLDDALLSPALSGTTADLFHTMFGLDHETLRESAEALLEGKGHAGESLFSAGAGAHDVRALRERLKTESERLFTPRGREQKVLTKLIGEVREARARVDEQSTSVQSYVAQERGLDAERKVRDGLAKERAVLLAERAKIQRLLDVLPHLTRDQEIGAELAALGEGVRLDPGAPDRRREAVRDLEDARRSREAVLAEITALRERLSALGAEPPIVQLDEAVIAALAESRGRHVAAERDMPKREGELRALEEAARRALAAVDADLSLEDVGRLRIGASHAARIRKLSDERRVLDSEAAHLSRELRSRDEKREILISRLWPRSGGPVELSELSVPSPETVDRFASDLAVVEARVGEISTATERVRSERRAAQEELDVLGRLGTVPTETDLERARATRDAAIRDWTVAEHRPDAESANATLWGAVRAADDVGDRLRREADRVYKVAALTSKLSALDAEERVLTEKAQTEENLRQALRSQWQDLWSGTRVPVGSPAEMRPVAERFARLVEVEAERAHLEKERRRVAESVEAWSSAFREAIAPLPVSPRASIEEVAAVLQATFELLRKMEDVEQMRRRVDGMRRDSAAFAEETERLSRRFLLDLGGVSHAAAADHLIRTHRQAMADRAERARLAREIEIRSGALQKLEAAHGKADARLSALFAEASVTNLAELEDAERRSERARSLAAERDRTRRELNRLGDGATLEALVAETRGFDADRARVRREELAEEIERVDTDLRASISRIATLEAGLPKLEQGAQDPALVLSDRVAALKREAQRYLRVRLASIVLEREIERYRQANQGPILERATELLPRLTLGNYTGLRVGYGDDDDTASLLCVRKDGAQVGVEGLSVGTRDALYLALRLASLERYVRNNEPMPLVLDDILIQLDDDRARAALSVLSDVAQLTQVLFFTHHARLVELAKDALAPGKLSVHTLPG